MRYIIGINYNFSNTYKKLKKAKETKEYFEAEIFNMNVPLQRQKTNLTNIYMT